MNSVGMPTGQSDVVMVRWLNRLGSTLRNVASEGTGEQKAELTQAVEHRSAPAGEADVGTQTWAGAREGKQRESPQNIIWSLKCSSSNCCIATQLAKGMESV